MIDKYFFYDNFMETEKEFQIPLPRAKFNLKRKPLKNLEYLWESLELRRNKKLI